MSKLFDKQVNARKEKNFRGSRKLPQAHEKVCDEKWNKVEQKKWRAPKIFLMEGGVYKVIAEHSCNGYQTTPAHRFLIHWRYYLF